MFHDPEIFKAAIDNLPVGVYMVDTNLKVVFWSRGAEKISGYLSQDMLGRHCREKLLVDLDGSNPVACGEACQLTDSMRDGQMREADVLLRHRTGHRIPVHVRAIPLRNSHNKIIGATEYFEESRLIVPFDDGKKPNAAGRVDKATGLFDVSTINLRLKETLADFAEHRLSFCVLMAQLDDLKTFQQHGKDAVEAARVVVAHTLSNALRPMDIAGCWHDQKFLAILRNCERPALKKVAERVRKMESYSQVEWWGDELSVTVSLGGTAVTEGDQVDTLVQRAQSALQQSIQDGGNRITVFPEDAIGGVEG